MPSYACIREGPDHAPRFKAVVNFNGEAFESPSFCTTLRQAEHAAAEVALDTLSKRGPSRSLAAKVLDETGVYKNLLQETAHRAGLKLPVYTTIRSGPGHTPIFSCTVELGGMNFNGEPAKTKKQAQKNAAMAAWSALKQLPQFGSSSSSSPSSQMENDGTEAQEQVIVAQALANLRQTDATKPTQAQDHQHTRRRPPHNRRNTNQPAAVSFYSTPYQSWTYPNFSPEISTYQMWQQAQASEQQRQLLALSSPSHPTDSRFLPFMWPTFQQRQGQFFPGVEPCTLNSVPCPSRSRSGVAIQEIQDEKNQVEDNKWQYSRKSDSSPLLNNAVQKVEARCEDKERIGGISSVEAPLNDKTDFTLTRSVPAHSGSEPSISQGSGVGKKILDSQPGEGSQRKQSEPPPGGSIWPRPSPRSHAPLMRPRPPVRPQLGGYCPPSPCLPTGYMPAPFTTEREFSVRPSGYSGGFRLRVPSMIAPVTIRTAVPVCSASPGTVNPGTRAFVAPAVHVRSVIPVCSAPSGRMPDAAQIDGQQVASLDLEFDKVKI